MDNSKEFHDAFVKMIGLLKKYLSEKEFNEFVYKIYTYGIENVYITEIPVYENAEYNGCVLWKRIKGMRYKITCKNFKGEHEIGDYEIWDKMSEV